ncbi:hypothetical protein [Microvirga massiliensis]|uniref:hypothetical protein n=1 Tax=Microvirga massiliensis TaxID=1033741 RepID=UPI000B2B23CE|nr:hypothetical protein [Microvirga massiliensis]
MIMLGPALAVAAVTSFLAFGAQAQDSQTWCKSKYGPNDEIGAANLLTPEVALNAAKLVKTGKPYSLGAETSSKTPAYGPRSWALAINQPG